MLGGAFFDHGNHGVLVFFEGFAKADFGGHESGEIRLGHEKDDTTMAESFELGPGMVGGGFPVFIDEGDLDIRLWVATDQGGDFLFMKPLLNLAGTLVKNPSCGIGVVDQGGEFFCRVFEVEEPG